jgi:cytochrome c biogenesis protein CcdA
MSRTVLIIVGIILVAMGILALVDWDLATEPAWHAWLKIIIGVIAVIIGAADSPKEA